MVHTTGWMVGILAPVVFYGDVALFISMLGVLYSPMVPSLTRWQSGKLSASRTANQCPNYIIYLGENCMFAVNHRKGAERCSPKCTIASGSNSCSASLRNRSYISPMNRSMDFPSNLATAAVVAGIDAIGSPSSRSQCRRTKLSRMPT